jgi:hypothetical protein
MTDTRRNALDTALIKLNQAQSYLELNSPGKKDFEQARDHAKDGLDLIKACLVALDHDCFEIMDRPPLKPEPGPSLFTPTGAPSAEAEVPAAPPVALPALGCIDVDVVSTRKFKVGDRVKDVDGDLGTVVEDLGGNEETDTPYQVEVAGFRTPFEWNAEDLTLVTPEDEIRSERFPAPPKANQKKTFEERLVTLEEMFGVRLDPNGDQSESDLLKAFRPHRTAWAAAWKADDRSAWEELLGAIADANLLANDFSAWSPKA